MTQPLAGVQARSHHDGVGTAEVVGDFLGRPDVDGMTVLGERATDGLGDLPGGSVAAVDGDEHLHGLDGTSGR